MVDCMRECVLSVLDIIRVMRHWRADAVKSGYDSKWVPFLEWEFLGGRGGFLPEMNVYPPQIGIDVKGRSTNRGGRRGMYVEKRHEG